MSALANRSAGPKGTGPAAPTGSPEAHASAADAALLDALPIAAAVVVRASDGLEVLARNTRFEEVLALSVDPAVRLGDLRALAGGPIGTMIDRFLDDYAEPSEYEFRDGDEIRSRHYRMKLAPLPRPEGDGAPRCLVSLVDRTLEVQQEKSLRAEMLRDSLTGLPNRLSFTESIEAQLATRDGREANHAVLVIDMRRFSRINESMGSLAGDELIITFARRLMSTLRAGDVLARTGGNEFGILVAIRRGADDAVAAADRILATMNAPFRLSEMEIRVECAIGVALMARGQDSEELFRSAQFAVKQAKQAGRPQVYAAAEASAARRRFSIETELRRALEKEQLQLNFQPLINLRTGQVSGFEALARWHHDDRGEISPSEFIPVAEESGLIVELGRWAMDRAAATLAEWDRAAGERLPVYVGVNLSAIQVARDDVAAMVGAALKAHGIDGQRLTLELTESSIVNDPGRAMRVFEALKGLDATVAMDDFGTGYSSLAYLQRLPIDVLKIDRSFVSGMLGDADSVAIVRAILSLADALNMSTIAEGVESVELATTLSALGCVAGQGFYFAKPLEARAALAYLENRRKA